MMNFYNKNQRKFSNIWKCSIFIWVSFLFSPNMNAQVAVNPGAGSYTTLKDAFDAINLGTHTGAIIVDVSADTAETASAVLNANGVGGASYTTILIQPTGAGVKTITGNIAGHLLDLNGADSVTINGTNANATLVISNTSTGTGSSTIRFINDASGNTITNATILGSTGAALTSGFGVVYFATGTTTGNDNNSISNCNIGPAGTNLPINGIYSFGTSTPIDNSSNIISNNNIYNYFNTSSASSGININSNSSGWEIRNNNLYQTATRTYTTANTHTGISILIGSGYSIINNTIGGNSSILSGTYAMAGAVASRFIGIYITSGNTTSAVNSIQGNTISNFTLATTSGASSTTGVFCGISVTNGNNNIGTVTGNTIGATTGVNNIVATSSTSGALVVGIHNGSIGTIAIQNNTIGALTSSGATAAIAGSISGIINSGAATLITISNNTIGNATADNMRGGTSGLTTGSSLVSGINLPGTPTTAIINTNTIQNLVSYGTGTAGFVRGILTSAATGSTTLVNISNNTIENFVSNNANTSISNGLSGVMGIGYSTGTNSVISQNTIRNLANTNTGTNGSYVVGIGHGNATNTTITRNTIYNLRNAGTSTSLIVPSVIAGVIIRSGTTTINVNNNMISLGDSQNTNSVILGINSNNGSTPDPLMKIYHNSINIEGIVSAGAQPSFCYSRTDFSTTARSAAVDLKNNILNNIRSGGTGSHFAIANNYGATTSSAIGWATNASNYNVLNANAATIGHWTTAQTFTGWKTASASDANSISAGAVPFVNSANADLHLNFGVTPTQIESGGFLTDVLVDFDNQTRPGPTGSVNGGGSNPDIGADEFDGVYLDVMPPLINYTPLTFICDGTTNRTLIASITDATGVPTSGAGLPVLYWRINTGAWNAATGTYVSGSNYSFSFGSGAILADTVQYYIVAQDLNSTPNSTSFPLTGASGFSANPPAVATPPTTPSSYQISGVLTGTYTVGATGNYPTLTAAVTAYNTSCIGGPVLFSLTDATYPTETYPITVLNNSFASATNTLTIQPATGIDANFSGSVSTALIILQGADYVTINGNNSNQTNSICPLNVATRNLTFQNSNTSITSAVISIQNIASDGASFNTILNCNVIGNTNATTLTGINISGPVISSGANALNIDNNSIINNRITKAQFGIFAVGQSTAIRTVNGKIEQNVLDGIGAESIGRIGIMVLNANSYTVNGNIIKNIDSSISNDAVAILMGSTSMSNTILIGAETSNSTIANNIIDNIVQRNTFSAGGIVVAPTNLGTTTITNNLISNVYANGTANDIGSGILIGGGTSVFNVYHNSVTMNTSGALTGGSFPNVALSILGTNPNVSILNNILVANGPGNGATIGNIAIGFSTALPIASVNSNYNDLFAGGTSSQIGLTTSISNAGVIHTTLSNWQTNAAKDANSISTFPTFIAPNNLHLDLTSNNLIQNLGTPIASVTNDVDCELRSATAPDMGADEILCTLSNGATEALGVITATQAGATYQWYTCPNSILTGETNQTFTPTVVGDYKVVITLGGCSVESSCITVNTLSSNQFSKVDGFIAYPNPTTNILNVEFTAEISKVSIANMLGQQVMVKNVKANNAQIDMTNLNVGMYFVTIEANNVSKTIKVVKK